MALWSFVRGVQHPASGPGAALISGACIAAAGFTRFNFASLAVVLLTGWLIHTLRLGLADARQVITRYVAGGLMASLPVTVLIALAPRGFYYSNLVYIRLNTIYYEQLLRRAGMDLGSKLRDFANGIRVQPLDLLCMLCCHIWLRHVADGSHRRDLASNRATPSRCGSPCSPTPGLLQYCSADLPYSRCSCPSMRRAACTSRHATGTCRVVAAAVSIRNPLMRLHTWATIDGYRPTPRTRRTKACRRRGAS
jgi:hypothetical protein